MNTDNGNNSMQDCVKYLRDNLSVNDVYLQMCEESSELSQASAKMVRVLNNTNPTPVTYSEALTNFLEEMADVLVCWEVLVNRVNKEKVSSLKEYKMSRWANRLSTKSDNKKNNVYTVDGKECKIGDVYYGKSDGKKWTLTSFSEDKYPYTLQVAHKHREGTPSAYYEIKQVKPEWMGRSVQSVKTWDNVTVHIGNKVYTDDSLLPYTIKGISEQYGMYYVTLYPSNAVVSPIRLYSKPVQDSKYTFKHDKALCKISPLGYYCRLQGVTDVKNVQVEEVVKYLSNHFNERIKKLSLNLDDLKELLSI